MCTGSGRLQLFATSPLSMASLVSWGQVRDYTSWVASVHQELQMEEASWDPRSILLRFRAHQWLWAELKAREKLQQQATKMGQQALLAAGTPAKVGIFPSSQPTLSSLRLPSSHPTPLLLPSVSSQRSLLGSISAPPPPQLPTLSSSGPGWASNPTGGTRPGVPGLDTQAREAADRASRTAPPQTVRSPGEAPYSPGGRSHIPNSNLLHPLPFPLGSLAFSPTWSKKAMGESSRVTSVDH